jgi:hypothetical protein
MQNNIELFQTKSVLSQTKGVLLLGGRQFMPVDGMEKRRIRVKYHLQLEIMRFANKTGRSFYPLKTHISLISANSNYFQKTH